MNQIVLVTFIFGIVSIFSAFVFRLLPMPEEKKAFKDFVFINSFATGVVSLFITLAGILLKLDEITVLYLFMGDVFIIGGISIIQFIVKTVKVTNQKKQEQDNNNI